MREIPNILFDHAATKIRGRFGLRDLQRRRANSNLWQRLTGETNPPGVCLKAQDCEAEYDSGILEASSHLVQSIHRVFPTC